MADGRMLKKQISRSKKLARLKTDSARMLYTWIIPHLDIEGRLEADPHIVKGEVVPRLETFTPENIQEYLEDMAAWCRLVSLCGDRDGEALRMEDSRGALGPGEEMR